MIFIKGRKTKKTDLIILRMQKKYFEPLTQDKEHETIRTDLKAHKGDFLLILEKEDHNETGAFVIAAVNSCKNVSFASLKKRLSPEQLNDLRSYYIYNRRFYISVKFSVIYNNTLVYFKEN